ncbi:MAG: iron-sulfur cluster-binding protein [Gemmatimonadota bacterium]|nr:MAG: iron-sulfur cluster-binding protein [Gemmatimonadota bacterium]
MSVDVRAPYKTRVRQALKDEALRTALDRATDQLSGRRAEAMAAVDAPRLRDEARRIREYAIDHLPELLEQLERNLTANGCQVHWARDAEEARLTVLEIARRHRVRHAVKSKSMVTEEIGLNEALERAGIKVVETDLGEYIIQLAGEPPSHIITPVIHKRVEDVSELFQRHLGMPATNDPADICATARRELRREFLRAEMGISGCNFAIAETGTVCIITNEGNGRMVTSMPRVYVAVAGIEKVVPRIEDAVLLWQTASRSATGQEMSVYFSLSSGPRRPGHADGPDEMHVILLDNGRSRILERGYRDALLCIRCGACINVCPVYREIGGHAYGATPYSGPIGAVITPLLAADVTAAKELPFASSLCGACRDACPVKIDLPRLLLDLRDEVIQRRASPALERAAVRAYSETMRRPVRYGLALRLAHWITRLVAGGKDGDVSRLPPPLNAWTRTRVFPSFAARSFHELCRRREQRSTRPPTE